MKSSSLYQEVSHKIIKNMYIIRNLNLLSIKYYMIIMWEVLLKVVVLYKNMKDEYSAAKNSEPFPP